MKKFKIIVIMFLIISIPNNISGLTYDEAIETAENYVANQKAYKDDYNNYLIIDDKNNEYYKDFTEERTLKYGGLLSYEEFLIITNKKYSNWSFLYGGIDYWTYTKGKGSDDNRIVISNIINIKGLGKTNRKPAAKITEYIKPEVKVNGSGTKSDPWMFLQIHTIKLDHQGGNKANVTNSVIAAYGEKLPKIDILPEKTGYTLNGYYSDIYGQGHKYYNEYGKSNEVWNIPYNFTLYAYWIANKYTVTFIKEPGGGGDNETVATYGSPMPPITAPTRNGYTFVGYFENTNGSETKYYNADGTSAKDWNIAEPGTLYARWTAKQYTIEFKKELGGGGDDNTTATYDMEMPPITTPKRVGYSFDGYYTGTNGSGTKYYNADGTSAKIWDITSENPKLYAKWVAKKYTIKFNKQPGTGGDDNTTATYDMEMNPISIPIRNNYIFTGYFTGDGIQYYKANGTSARAWDIDDEITLYAKWTEARITVLSSLSCNNIKIGTPPYQIEYNGNCNVSGQNTTNWKVSFLTPGARNIKFNGIANVDIFLVGGGGGGGRGGPSGFGWTGAAETWGGGGGGGGYTKTYKNQTIVQGTYTISVGSGGGSNQNGGRSYLRTNVQEYAADGGKDGGRNGGAGGSGGGRGGGWVCTSSPNWWGEPCYVARNTGGDSGSRNGGSAGGRGQGSTTCEFGEGNNSGCYSGVTMYSYGGSGGHCGKNGGSGQGGSNSGFGGGGSGCSTEGRRGGDGIIIIRNKK